MSRTNIHDVAFLEHGRHWHPCSGACLMELASTIGGGRWSDHPSNADPVLATLTRHINDRTSPDARRALTSLAPWLAPGPETLTHRYGTSIAILAGRTALAHADPHTADWLAPEVSALTLPPQEGRWQWLHQWQQNRHGIRLTRSAVRLLSHTPHADQLLANLLQDAINLTRHIDGLPPLPAEAINKPLSYPATLPVQAELRTPDTAESAYYHCTALLSQWPAPLRTACQIRLDEFSNPISSANQTAGNVDLSVFPA